MSYKTPFKDAVGLDSVPHKGTGKAKYGSESGEDMPGRDGGFVQEMNRDTTFSGPSNNGTFKTPFKDAVD